MMLETNPLKVLDLNDLDGSFRRFSMVWHPDRGGNATVFAKVSSWRDKIKAYKEDKTNEIPGVRFFKDKNGVESRMIFVKKMATDTGCMYLAKGVVAFSENMTVSDVFNSAFPKFTFKDDKMRKGMEYFLPMKVETVEEKDTVSYVITKDKDLVPLQVLIEYLGGCQHILPAHAAWMTSRMLHIACYLGHVGIVHTGFNPINLFVNPLTHGAALMGGWRLSRKVGETFKGVPAFTTRFAPRSVIETRRAAYSMDLTVIKAISRMVFGDVNGRHLHEETPKAVRKWLNTPPARTALEEYKLWEEALKGFGPRRFVEMNVKPADIYAKMT